MNYSDRMACSGMQTKALGVNMDRVTRFYRGVLPTVLRYLLEHDVSHGKALARAQ